MPSAKNWVRNPLTKQWEISSDFKPVERTGAKFISAAHPDTYLYDGREMQPAPQAHSNADEWDNMVFTIKPTWAYTTANVAFSDLFDNPGPKVRKMNPLFSKPHPFFLRDSEPLSPEQ